LDSYLKDFEFKYFLILDIGIGAEFPIVATPDKMSEMFMLQNVSKVIRTGHVNTWNDDVKKEH
jgi:hypothetical protein